MPRSAAQGKCNATLIVRVWDDDSIEDGQENVGTNDDGPECLSLQLSATSVQD